MAGSTKTHNALRRMVQQRHLYLMLLPAFACIVAFNYAPVSGWVMAFTKYNVGKSMWQAPWVGLKHFKDFFAQSTDAFYVIRNTVVMNVLSICVGLGAAFVFSILLNETPGKLFAKTVQTVTFFPYFMSWVILYSLLYALLSTSSGAINQTLLELGLLESAVNVLGDKRYSWPLIVLVNTWNSLGYNSVIFLAAIAGIPKEQYEAADIDGAGRFDRIRFITVPNMVPTLIVLLIMNSGWIFSSGLDQYFVFTNATNKETMEVFDMYIYRYGLKLLNYSYATAVGIIKTTVSLALILAVNKVSRKVTDRSLF